MFVLLLRTFNGKTRRKIMKHRQPFGDDFAFDIIILLLLHFGSVAFRELKRPDVIEMLKNGPI